MTAPAAARFGTYVVASLLPVLGFGLLLVSDAQGTADTRMDGRGRAQAYVISSMVVEPVVRGRDAGDLGLQDVAQLRRVTSAAIDAGSVRFLALRSVSGEVVYADAGPTTAFAPAGDPSFTAAAAGTTTVRHVETGTGEGTDHILVVAPLQADRSGRPAGILEIGLPAADIVATAERDLRRTYLTLALGLLVIYVVQAALAWWTTRRVRRSDADRDHRALHDGLTSLPNRHGFQAAVAAVVERVRAGGAPATVVLVDLDHFKEVNDTLGHAAGDDLLQVTASRLTAALRPADTVARLGGDEFGVILDGVGDVELAERLLERVRAEIGREVALRGVPLAVEASFGVALVQPGSRDAELVLQHVDVALRQAKRSGAGVVVWGEELDTHSAQRLALQAELRRALERDELVLHYQPQLDLATGEVVGVEALVRWQHPERGLLPPAGFLAAVEQSGLINPFTSWVLRRAVLDCAEWTSLGLEWAVSVNVSVRNLVGSQLAEEVAELLALTGLEASKLTVEITETALAADQATLAAAVGALSDLGVEVSIDDFGTGFTTFALLRLLRINEIKVDRGFVEGVLTRDEDRAIVQAVVGLARGIGCRVVAEGVETAEIDTWLRELGCTRGQGYHYSRPLPWRELLERDAQVLSRATTTSG